MNKDLNLDKIGKRMPYSMPEGFMDSLQERVWQEVKDDFEQNKAIADAVATASTEGMRKHRRLWLRSMAASVAAVVVLAMLLIPNRTPSKKVPDVSIYDVEAAFDRLPQADQMYLMNIYQEDVFAEE